MSKAVQTERHDGFVVWRIDRPDKHNALNDEAMTALEEAVTDFENDQSARCAILTGSGDQSFCAGGDLRYFDSLKTREEGLAMSRRMQNLLNRFQGNRPVIAVLNGDAYGGGCEMMLACHIRIAADHARIAFRQAANGVVTGWGGAGRLFSLVGRGTALRLLLTSERIDTAEAQRLHLIDRVVPGSELMDTAFDMARTISKNSHTAVAGFLDLSYAFKNETNSDFLRRETRWFCKTWVGEDFQDVLARYRK